MEEDDQRELGFDGCDGIAFPAPVPCNPPTCSPGRRLDDGGDDHNEERELGSVSGYTFDQWQEIVKYQYPGCSLAPVRSKEQLEYYETLTCDCSGCEALVGITLDDPKVDGVKCHDALTELEEEDGDGHPEECYDGWVNTVDGSPVPDEADLWASGRPSGINDYGRIFGFANIAANGDAILFDQCDAEISSFCKVFPYAIIECCDEPTCYARKSRGCVKR